jgi:hypothetical protein
LPQRLFAHPSFQYFAQDGQMGKTKKSTENQVITVLCGVLPFLIVTPVWYVTIFLYP